MGAMVTDEDYEKWQASLAKKFPLLYRSRRRGWLEFGLRGPGWFGLIENLSASLEGEIVRLRSEGLPTRQLPRASMIKEKLGALRIYVSSATPAMSKLILEAETKSATICEICGQPGESRYLGEMVLCGQHQRHDE